MHQPLIPAGGTDLGTAAIISNLQHMRDYGNDEARYNAGIFAWCYKRMGEFIPQLIHEGKQPRIMLDYSGCLLHGLRTMGLDDVLDSLRTITCDPAYRRASSGWATAWGHAVAPSTPVQDFRLHVRAWQHHFAGIFGLEALSRVRGFSPPEMALPNHPDVAYEFVRTLKDCGYRWVLVQEHSVERVEDGGPSASRTCRTCLVARNSRGRRPPASPPSSRPRAATPSWWPRCSLTMRPRACPVQAWRGKSVPPVTAQIADGENGGVMMNEFPSKYLDVMREAPVPIRLPSMSPNIWNIWIPWDFASGTSLPSSPSCRSESGTGFKGSRRGGPGSGDCELRKGRSLPYGRRKLD